MAREDPALERRERQATIRLDPAMAEHVAGLALSSAYVIVADGSAPGFIALITKVRSVRSYVEIDVVGYENAIPERKPFDWS